jgi:hypothetical protein
LDRLRCRIFLVEDVFYPAGACSLTEGQILALSSVVPDLVLFNEHERSRLGFSLKIKRGLFDAGTVAYSALQIASWLGFGHIDCE